MTAAALAEDFHPAHTVAGVRRFAYRLIINSREKLGQPEPESYLASALNKGAPQQRQV